MKYGEVMERKGYDKTTGEFNHAGILAFDLSFVDFDLESDCYGFLDPSGYDDPEEARDRLLAFIKASGVSSDESKLRAICEVWLGDENAETDLAATIVEKSEWRAMAEIEAVLKPLGARLGNEGHNDCELVCHVGLTSYKQLTEILAAFGKWSGGDSYYCLSIPYYEIRGVVLYPDVELYNGRQFSLEPALVSYDGSIDEWLEENKPNA